MQHYCFSGLFEFPLSSPHYDLSSLDSSTTISKAALPSTLFTISPLAARISSMFLKYKEAQPSLSTGIRNKNSRYFRLCPLECNNKHISNCNFSFNRQKNNIIFTFSLISEVFCFVPIGTTNLFPSRSENQLRLSAMIWWFLHPGHVTITTPLW